MVKKTTLFIILIAWILVIASLSAEIGDKSRHRGTQAAKFVIACISNSNMPINYSIGNDDETLLHYIRKLGHVMVYFVLALLIHTLLRHTKLSRGKSFALAIIFSLVCACLDEYNQLHISGRDGTFMDIIIDSIGIAGALTVSISISKIKEKISGKA